MPKRNRRRGPRRFFLKACDCALSRRRAGPQQRAAAEALRAVAAQQRNTELTARAENIKGLGDKQLTAGEQKQAMNDMNKTMAKMTDKEKTDFTKMSSKDQKDFVAQKFLEQENKGNLLRGYGTQRFGGSALLGPGATTG